MKTGGRNIYLDLWKYVLSFFVIMIHLTAEDYWFFPLYRLAVPMFFLISGYFNYAEDPEKRLAKAKQFISRSFRYMIIGFAFYIVFDFIMCYVNGNGVGYYFTTLFYEDLLLEFFILNRPITYTGAQLWFLIALFVISLIHFGAIKFQKTRYYKYAIPACFAIYFFFAGYMYLLQYTDMPLYYTRNALFVGFPNFALGYLLARVDFHKKGWYKYLYLSIGLGAFFFQIIEARLAVMEMYISGVIAEVMLLQFFLGIRQRQCKFYYAWFGKDGPFGVYILHMAVFVVQEKLWPLSNGLLNGVVVFVLSFALYELCYLIMKWWHSYRAAHPPRLVTEGE